MFIYLMIMNLIIMSFLSFLMFMFLYSLKLSFYIELNLIMIESIKLELLFLLDWMSSLFISTVMIISSMVMYYSIEYMSRDLSINRFFLLILMFVFSMLLMILSPNIISLMIGWDGLGLISYCLVIYYQNKKSFNSGMVTVLTNRVGDILILMSVSLMMYVGSWNIMFLGSLNNLILLLLLIAAFTKSAQIPYSSWLPLAMAAPTPVSALVHSSTLVTAGVYLMIRMNYLFLEESNLNNMIMIISVFTMLISGMGANFEFDLKKIIALSTLSQLSLMFFCLSLKLDELTIFHLLTHAMFKSLLFMCAGVIIHHLYGKQDIRLLSLITFNYPLVSLIFLVCSFSLCGLPFLSGFFSKDLILEMFLMNFYNKIILTLLFMSMGVTMMYTIRLFYYSFIKLPKFEVSFYFLKMSSGGAMIESMYFLFFMSVMFGCILSWLMFSYNFICLSMQLKMLIYMSMIGGCLMSMLFSNYFLEIKNLIKINNLLKFFMMLGFMPLLYSYLIKKILDYSEVLVNNIDLGWIEYSMNFMMMNFMKNLFKISIKILSNHFFHIFMFIVVMIIMILF